LKYEDSENERTVRPRDFIRREVSRMMVSLISHLECIKSVKWKGRETFGVHDMRSKLPDVDISQFVGIISVGQKKRTIVTHGYISQIAINQSSAYNQYCNMPGNRPTPSSKISFGTGLVRSTSDAIRAARVKAKNVMIREGVNRQADSCRSDILAGWEGI
jgi:hypothetical protein